MATTAVTHRAKDLWVSGKASDYNFADVTSELYRVYCFPSGFTVRIEAPQWLYVSRSGGHRILDGQGLSHYIPSGWEHLFWKARKDEPHFVL